jgi:hypothetical protein
LLPPVASALQEARERVEILPPRDPPQMLAFGKGRIAQLAGSKVVFRDTADGSVIAESDLGAARAVTVGIDGSLGALGLSSGARLEPHLKKPRSFPHVAFFPGAALFPDLEDARHFYVYYAAEQQLFHYPFEAEAGRFLPIDDRFPLSGCVAAPVLTHDGAFLCVTTDGIERRAPRGREARFKWPAEVKPGARLLPGKRLDELFSAARSGEVTHLRMQAGFPVLGRFQLPEPLFAAAANEDALAFVLVSAPGGPRRFSLLVTDFDGHERLKAELPSRPTPASEDWLDALTGDENLAISGYEPLVAVGGPGSLRVWDYEKGTLVFSR